MEQRRRGGGEAGRGSGSTPTYFASFISICCRISCRSWSLRTGKMLRSSSSCLLGRFRSFTASSSFLILRGRVPVRAEQRSAEVRKGHETRGLVKTESFDSTEFNTGKSNHHALGEYLKKSIGWCKIQQGSSGTLTMKKQIDSHLGLSTKSSMTPYLTHI